MPKRYIGGHSVCVANRTMMSITKRRRTKSDSYSTARSPHPQEWQTIPPHTDEVAPIPVDQIAD